MLVFADALRARNAGLRVRDVGGSNGDTSTPMESMLITGMAALAQMEREIKCERVTDSLANPAGSTGPGWPAGGPAG